MGKFKFASNKTSSSSDDKSTKTTTSSVTKKKKTAKKTTKKKTTRKQTKKTSKPRKQKIEDSEVNELLEKVEAQKKARLDAAEENGESEDTTNIPSAPARQPKTQDQIPIEAFLPPEKGIHLEHLLITNNDIDVILNRDKRGLYSFVYNMIKKEQKKPRDYILDQISNFINELLRNKFLEFEAKHNW